MYDHLATILDNVINPTLLALPIPRSAVVAGGLLGVGLVESGYRTRRQIGGPALGYWQMEPVTHDDIWETFLQYRPALRSAVLKILNGDSPVPNTLTTNDKYACAMARIKLLRAPEPLPSTPNPVLWADYWKDHYNTSLGAGEVARAIPLFRLALNTAK